MILAKAIICPTEKSCAEKLLRWVYFLVICEVVLGQWLWTGQGILGMWRVVFATLITSLVRIELPLTVKKKLERGLVIHF